MTDRLSPYAMIPSFNTSLIQQQQQLNQAQQAQQQSQQVQMDPQQTRQGFIKPDQRQMWQQMHQQQTQPGFRAQTASDIPSSPQLADFLRSQQQGMNRPNDSQSPQFSTNNAPIPQQQAHPNFISSGHPQPPQPFGSMQALNSPAARNTLMPSNNQGQMRQLELLQQHPGHTNNFSRVSQQSTLNPSVSSQNISTDTFATVPPGGPIGSPALQNKPQTPQSGQQQQSAVGQLGGQPSGLPAGRRPMTLVELNERARQVKEQINNLENMAMQLTQQRSGMPDAAFMQKMQFILKETQSRKEYLQKVAHAATQQFGNVGGATALNTNPLTQASGAANQSVQGNAAAWMTQLNGAKGSNLTPSLGNAQSVPLNLRSMPPNMSGSPASGSQQHPNGQRAPPSSAQMPFDSSNSGPAVSSNPQGNSFNLAQIIPSPLEKNKFENAYQNYCKSKSVTLNPRLMMIDNRSIDLHALHVQIMSEGGAAKVNANDLWPVVGARLGFVQFPGTDHEPAKSGPGVAQQLAHIYKEYLAVFDQIYIQSVVDSRRKIMQQSQAQMNGMRGLTALQMQRMSAYANIPAEQLRAQGVPEPIIHFVEANRTSLQRNAAEHLSFRGQLRPNLSAPQSSDLDRSGSASTYNPANPPAPGRVAPLMAGSSTQTPSNSNVGMPSHQVKPENMQASIGLITRLEQESTLPLSQLRPQEIPNDSRMEFNNLLEQVHRLSTEMRPKLAMFYAMIRNEEPVRRLLQIISTVQYQRTLLSSNPPKYVLNMDMLRNMLASVQRQNEQFQQIVHHHKQLSASNSEPPRPPVQTATPQATPQAPQHPAPTTSRTAMQVPPKKATSATSPPPLSAASPSASTPVNSAPTPGHVASSPQPPKSPKAKGTPKPAAKKARRASKAQPPTPNQPASTSTPASQQEEPSPAAPSPTGSLKRPRDDQPNAPSPSSSKRPKTDADSPITSAYASEVPLVNKMDASAIKTEEEASAFFEQMTELIRIASDNDPQESLSADISDTLDMILKGCSGDETDRGRSLSLSSLEFPELSGSSRVNPVNEFPEFIDLSSYGGPEDDDAAFKVATPDLIPSSSANPSPESASSDPDLGCKLEDTSDPLRLGIWKEIDGGESAYYTQQGDWKWDSPMPSSEQAWAIFTGS